MAEEIQTLKRCAIYTRKSTNSLLDRDINSLTTQREICSSYIRSQQYRGWVELPHAYDDGGHSGSGLKRPALAQLMQDIEDGEVDAIVVYKIDRLTRSLMDFVRLIEIFDRQNIALVSISQAFDTSNSMGQLILNILLTFSQFERELIAERVRDSIRTRKRHGKVHGGMAPFGYEYTNGGPGSGCSSRRQCTNSQHGPLCGGWSAGAIKACWVCEQAHQQLKEELGLDHFEGRSWKGLHRHALMFMIAQAFLQPLRLKQG